MSNLVYPKAKEALLLGDLAWDTADVRVVLVDLADYTFDSSHQFLSSVPAGARVAVTAAGLANKTGVSGVADADNVGFGNVSGDPSEALILYDHTGGADGARRLIAFLDTATGLPVTPNGGAIDVAWDNGANKIFAL
jgi:hypothetical protein